MKNHLTALLTAVVVLALTSSANADKPEQPPAGMGKFYLFLKQPPAVPNGQPPKKITPPDVAKLGGRVLHTRDTYRVIFLPLQAVKHLRADENVDFVQRVWMGESFEEWYATDSSSANGSGLRAVAHSDEEPPSWGPKAYAYDGSGNIKQIGTDAYRYDGVSRLTEAVINNTTETYEYDAFGNLTKKQIAGQSPSIVAIDGGSNRVATYTYDIAGNVTKDATQGYVYDSLGMMVARYGAGGTRRMIYTADDERIGVVLQNAGRWTIRDFEGRALREFRTYQPTQGFEEEDWIWTEDYVYAGGQVVGAETAGPIAGIPTIPDERRRRHFHLDHLGSVRLITTDGRVSLGTHTYYPFGAEQTAIHQEEATFGGTGQIRPEPMRFAGHQRDFYHFWDTDNKDYLDYMHARYYDPHGGRFLSVDPVLSLKRNLHSPQGWNRYAYARNNPISRVDPDGAIDVSVIEFGVSVWLLAKSFGMGFGDSMPRVVPAARRSAPNPVAYAAGSASAEFIATHDILVDASLTVDPGIGSDVNIGISLVNGTDAYMFVGGGYSISMAPVSGTVSIGVVNNYSGTGSYGGLAASVSGPQPVGLTFSGNPLNPNGTVAMTLSVSTDVGLATQNVTYSVPVSQLSDELKDKLVKGGYTFIEGQLYRIKQK